MELKRIVKPFAQRSAHIILPKELIGKEVMVYTKEDKVVYTKPVAYTKELTEEEKKLDSTTQERIKEQAKQQEEINKLLSK